MTCIIGLVDNDKVYIGGDSAGVSSYNISLRNDEKVFTKGDMVFGFTSSFRMGQLLRYKLKIPKQPIGIKDFEYLCGDFMDSVIKCFEDNKFATLNNNVIEGGVFLLGYKSKLYEVQSDFQVSSVAGGFDSCGCGDNYAKGAMRILINDKKLKAEEKIIKALEVAEYFSAGVSAPFNIVSV